MPHILFCKEYLVGMNVNGVCAQTALFDTAFPAMLTLPVAIRPAFVPIVWVGGARQWKHHTVVPQTRIVHARIHELHVHGRCSQNC